MDRTLGYFVARSVYCIVALEYDVITLPHTGSFSIPFLSFSLPLPSRSLPPPWWGLNAMFYVIFSVLFSQREKVVATALLLPSTVENTPVTAL